MLISSLILLGFIPQSRSTTETPFWIELATNKAVGFQHDPQILILENTGSLLNGTDATLTLNLDSGSLTFLNDVSTTIAIWAEQAPDGVDVGLSGAVNLTRIGETYNWTATFPATTLITIAWSWRIESFVDKYTMLGIGLVGVGLLFFSVIWATLGFRKNGFSINSVERFDIAMIIFLIGLGLIIVWLWR